MRGNKNEADYKVNLLLSMLKFKLQHRLPKYDYFFENSVSKKTNSAKLSIFRKR